MKIKGLYRLIFTALVVNSLGGCGKSSLSCSDAVVQDTVLEMVRQEFKKNLGLTINFDIDASKINLEGIRTRSSDERRTECAAHLTIQFELLKAQKKDAAYKKDAAGMQQLIKLMSNAASRDITYLAERTDKGDDVYVTIRGQ
jgi:hypothetical protein